MALFAAVGRNVDRCAKAPILAETGVAKQKKCEIDAVHDGFSSDKNCCGSVLEHGFGQ